MTSWEKEVEFVSKTSFMAWELAHTTEQKIKVGKTTCQRILELLAKQRTQLLKEVREKVIGKPFYKDACEYCEHSIDPNQIIKEQLKKLKELEKDKL